MRLAGSIAKEMTQALLVLALVLLNLAPGPQGPEARYDGGLAAYLPLAGVAGDLCGDEEAGAAPCHACRNDGLALPPGPPACPSRPSVLAAVPFPTMAAAPAQPAGLPPAPRGPPLA